MIESLTSINLRSVQMDDLQAAFNQYSKDNGLDKTPTELQVKMATNVKGNGVSSKNPNRLSFLITVEMFFGTQKPSEADDVLGSIKVIYEVRVVVSDYSGDLNSRENIEQVVPYDDLLSIAEPYFREMITSLLDRTELSLGTIPYRFWEKGQDE
ncbi:hypothetical protein [Levilactobacillus wangkuiensis]|uniref:hypothetical protein n=1 Tax=Levilactobacillus wangkuiensis TaxID=2799566 RepID=UPI001944A16A|nr:hypothetical protein [Levilactobacillus wangkuiensis]